MIINGIKIFTMTEEYGVIEKGYVKIENGKIAEVGETGAATGPHLHFELHDGKVYLNPIYYVEVG